MTERWTEAMVAEYQRKMREGTMGVSRMPASAAAFNNLAKPKPSKYRNRKTADGFDSEKERDVWLMLQQRERVGEITQLVRQVKIALVVNGVHVCDFKADYVWYEGARRVIGDCKSKVTKAIPHYRTKFKLMQALGMQIEELL